MVRSTISEFCLTEVPICGEDATANVVVATEEQFDSERGVALVEIDDQVDEPGAVEPVIVHRLNLLDQQLCRRIGEDDPSRQLAPVRRQLVEALRGAVPAFELLERGPHGAVPGLPKTDHLTTQRRQ